MRANAAWSHQSRLRWLTTFLVVVATAAIALGLGWTFAIFSLVNDTDTQLTYEQSAFSATRLYDATMTMDAAMAAQTGDSIWIDRYNVAEAELKRALEVALDCDACSSVTGLVATNAANDQLVRLERQALALVAAGDLPGAQFVMASGEYLQSKRDYAQSLNAAEAAFRTDVTARSEQFRLLIGVQVVFTLVLLLVVVLLSRTIASRALRAQDIARALMDAAVIGLARVGPDGVIVYANPALERLAGVGERGLVGSRLRDHFVADDRAEVDHAIVRAAAGDELTAPRLRLATEHETDCWVELVGAPMDRRRGHVVMQVLDVTEAARAQAELLHLARHDVLTGVSNRAVLADRLSRLGDDRRGAGGGAAVLFCDVDRLKAINDQYGHAAGDLALRAVATRLTESVRATDEVVRFGGDEFVILLMNMVDEEHLRLVADKLRASLGPALKLDELMVDITVSIGGTMLREDEDPQLALARADRALYEAKRGGRNRTELY